MEKSDWPGQPPLVAGVTLPVAFGGTGFSAGSRKLVYVGEPEGIRTLDPLIKSQVLYRLSYGLSSAGPYGCVAGKVNIKGQPRDRFPP